MAGATVNINIKAATKQAVSEIDALKGKFAGLTSSKGWQSAMMGVGVSAGMMAFNAAANAVQGLGSALADSVEKAAEEQVGIERMTQSLKANVPAWDGNTASIEKRIEAGQKLAFSDGELRDSLGTLVAATHDVDKAFALQRTAMDLARFKGISLADASTALIKVEGGQYRMLKSLGIVLKDGATQTEALAAVQAVAAGQADKYSGTYKGAIDKLNVAFENLQEDVGEVLIPVLTEFVGVLTDSVMPALRDLVGWLKDNKWAVDILGDAFVALLGPGGRAMVMSNDMRKALEEQKRAAEETSQTNYRFSDSTRQLASEFEGARDRVVQVAQDFRTKISPFMSEAGRQSSISYANGLKEGQNAVVQATEALRDAIKHPLGDAAHIAKLMGQLNGTELARGLADKREYVRARAEELRRALIAELDAATKGAYSAGVNASNAFALGVANKLKVMGVSLQGFAGGGDVRGGVPILVGEQGPEIFVPSASGSIIPNGQISAGGGSVYVSVNVSGPAVFDPYGSAATQIANALLPGLRRALDRNGMSLA